MVSDCISSAVLVVAWLWHTVWTCSSFIYVYRKGSQMLCWQSRLCNPESVNADVYTMSG